MNNITFKKDLLGVQDDLLRFAYKLTSEQVFFRSKSTRLNSSHP